MSFAATCMDLESVILTEVSQTEKEKYHVISCNITYMWNLKNGINAVVYKTVIQSQMQKTNLWLPGCKWGSDRL